MVAAVQALSSSAILRHSWLRRATCGLVGVAGPDKGRSVNAAEEATNLVMKLQNEGKRDRELLRAVALLATAVIKLAKKEA